jgi:hypothetical protein
MLSLSISYPDFFNFHYFADTTERGDGRWKQAQRQGDFMDKHWNQSELNIQFVIHSDNQRMLTILFISMVTKAS